MSELVACEKCQDQGHYPLDRGGITESFCDCEEGEKFRVKKLGELGYAEPVQVAVEESEAVCTGVLFQLLGPRTDEYTDEELWGMVKQTAIEKMEFPHAVVMPCCGKGFPFEDSAIILGLPIEDIPCPCGNPNHYLVKFEDNREEPPKKRKAANLKKRKRANSNPSSAE